MDKEKLQLTLFGAYMLLCLVGLTMVFSASCAIGEELFGSPYHFLVRQVLFLAAGIFLVFLILRYVNTLTLERYMPLILISALLLLILPLMPHLGHRVGGARRWIKIAGFSLQPSEFSKLLYTTYLSHYISRKKRSIVPPLVVLSIVGLLLSLEPDTGSVIFVSVLTFIMLFVGGFRARRLTIPFLAFGAVTLLLIKFSSYRMARITAFLSPWEYSRTHGYQLVQSFISLGSGGIFGKGLGSGTEKLFYLPEPHSDFIFAVIGEELGFVGILLVVVLFFALFLSGIKLCRKCELRFASSLILGLNLALTLQALIHMGVNLGLLPPKGITLPFVSYGGSSLVASSMAIGLMLRASEDG